MQINQIVKLSKDPLLKSVGYSNDISTDSSKKSAIEFIDEFIEELINYIDERKDDSWWRTF